MGLLRRWKSGNGTRFVATAHARAALLAAALAASAPIARAVDWQGGNGNWNASNATPGWNGTFPNAVGAVANHPGATSSIITQNVAGGVTVGAITLTNNSANGGTFTVTNGITLNQDGAGAGSALISNTNTDTSTSNILSFGAGNLTLADDLFVSNTGGSTNATAGAIQIASTIGGAGNITFSSASNTVTSSTAFPGAIRVQTAANTFVGSSLIQKGAVTFNNAAAFGPATNAITLGQSGQGAASLLNTNGITWNAWAITVASGATGELTLGAASTGAGTIPGAVTLNGDVSLRAESTGGNTTNFTGKITGGGNITKTGAGAVALSNNTNDFLGVVNAGSAGALLITQNNSLGATTASTTVNSGGQLRTNNNISVAEPLTLNGTGNANDGALRTNLGSSPTFTGQITLGSSGVLLFNNATAGTPTTPIISGGITGTDTDLTFSSLNSSGNWTVNTNPIATGAGKLTKTGAGVLTLAAGVTHTYTGTTSITGGTMIVNGVLGSGGGAVTVGDGVNANSGVLGGSGTINRDISISLGGTVSPGNSVGNLTEVGTQTWAGGGTYVWEITDATRGPDGNGVRWDHIQMTALNIQATSGNKFTIKIVGTPANLVLNKTAYVWTIASTAAGGIGGFDPAKFNLDFSSFTGTPEQQFFLEQNGDNLQLVFVPEPGSLALAAMAGVSLLSRRRRRR